MFRWIIAVFMTILTLLTGGVVTWQFNNAELTQEDKKIVENVKRQVETTAMKYIIVRYGVEWQNDNMAVVSGKTLFNIPVVTAHVDKRSVR